MEKVISSQKQKRKNNNIRRCTCRKCRQTPLGYVNVSKLTRSRHLKRDRELVTALDYCDEMVPNAADAEVALEDNIDDIGVGETSTNIETRLGC